MILKSKPKPIDQDIVTLNSDLPPETDEQFRALDHIKYTKKVSDTIYLWSKVYKLNRSIQSLQRINQRLPKAKAIKYDKQITNLIVQRYNANTLFQNSYNKLNQAQKIEFALRTNELDRLK